MVNQPFFVMFSVALEGMAFTSMSHEAFMVELSSLLIITEAADVPKDFKRVFVGSFGRKNVWVWT